MKVTFDEDGYVEMMTTKGELPNSVELEDDDTIDRKYLACYKLGFDGTKLVLDADKVQRLESNLRADKLTYDLRKQLTNTDYKVLRHIRETALGIPTSMSQNDYLMLEAQRESITRKIREIEDGCQLETDINAILQEGYKVRQQVIEDNQEVIDTIKGIKSGIKESLGVNELDNLENSEVAIPSVSDFLSSLVPKKKTTKKKTESDE